MSKPAGSGSKWPLTALAVILGALFLTRGGLASLIPLLRLALPVVVVVVVYKAVKSKICSAIGDAVRPRGGPGGGAAQVIDLCPKCGAYLRSGHRCAQT